jgi:hypothetical protein
MWSDYKGMGDAEVVFQMIPDLTELNATGVTEVRHEKGAFQSNTNWNLAI